MGLDTIYAPAMPRLDRARWRSAALAARFDRMPPFWLAFFLALTEVLGEGFLSLPLALAGLGPLPGVVLLVALGIVNVITVGAMAEAVVRNGSMRYGLSYVSRLVTELLGVVPASALGVIFAVDGFLAFWFYFLGFGSVLAGVTGIPIGVWMALLFVANVVLLRRETLDDTVASAVAIGLTTLALAVAMTVISLLNVDPANLAPAAVPGRAGGAPDVAVLGLVFGVVLMAFFGHTSAANSAKLILGIEPTGKALIGGNIAAMVLVVTLYCVSTFAIIGVVGPAPLLSTTGTALTPLAEKLGPAVGAMALVYTVLAIGIGSLYITLGTYNQVVERLPPPVPGPTRVRSWLGSLGTTRRGRLAAGFAPSLVVLLILEVVVYLGVDDFVGSIAFAGTLTVPFLVGVFPLLLVAAARRRGEYVPWRVVGAFGHPVVIAGLLAMFVVAVVVHAIIWDGIVERVAALGCAAVAVALIAWVLRSGALRPRAVVELRDDRRQRQVTIGAVGAGSTVAPEARVETAGSAPVGAVALPAGAWRELRVWPHRVTTDGVSAGLAATVEIAEEGSVRLVDVGAGSEPVLVPMSGSPATVTVRLAGGS